MSAKPRADSELDNLPQNQRDMIERWLFEENLSYKEAAARLLADCNVRSSPSAFSPFYQRIAQRRMLDRIVASRNNSNQVVETLRKNPSETMAALTALIAQMAFDQTMAGEKMNLKTLADLSSLALTNKSLDLKTQEISLKRDRFQFDAAKAAMKQLPALRKIASDNSLNETDKLIQARQLLFGQLPE